MQDHQRQTLLLLAKLLEKGPQVLEDLSGNYTVEELKEFALQP